MKRIIFFCICTLFFISQRSIFAIETVNNYSSIIEKLIYYKNDHFKVFFGGPISCKNGGVQWVMLASFEDDSYNTRSVYEISFINCDIYNAKNANVFFSDASDINIKFKNLLSPDYKEFSELLNGKYCSGKYIVIRSVDVSMIFYPDIHLLAPSSKNKLSDQKTILEFLKTQFKIKEQVDNPNYKSKIKEEIESENVNVITYKPIKIKVDLKGKVSTFYLEKKILKNDPWKLYYVVFNKPINSTSITSSETFPLVRIDSGCVCGQIYDDDSCDCLDQLHEMLYQMSLDQTKNSLIIHIPAHDGRGYGTAPKAETEIYKIGGKGRLHKTKPLNTMEAAKLLYESDVYDIRTYDGCAEILKSLGFNKIILLTDSILKVESLRKNSIEVVRKKTETRKLSCIKHIKAKHKDSEYYKN